LSDDALTLLNEELLKENKSLSQNKIDELFLEAHIRNNNGELFSRYLNDGSENKNKREFLETFVNYMNYISASDLDVDSASGIRKYIEHQKNNPIILRDIYLRDNMIKIDNRFSGVVTK
jgi:response regulator of citrate/malate metabolism